MFFYTIIISDLEKLIMILNNRKIVSLNQTSTNIHLEQDFSVEEKRMFFSMPLHLFEGDYVSLCTTQNLLSQTYCKELEFFLNNYSCVAKAIFCSVSEPPDTYILQDFSKIKNFRLIVSVSNDSEQSMINGLYILEVASIYGIKAIPLCYSTLPNLADLSFFANLKELGYSSIAHKKSITEYSSNASNFIFESVNDRDSQQKEHFKMITEEAGLELVSLNDWFSSQELAPHLEYKEAKYRVEELLKIAELESSDKNGIIDATIQRRL